MEQLSGVDTSFLTMETATTYGHVGDLAVFDEGGLTLASLRDLVDQRIHLLDPGAREGQRAGRGLEGEVKGLAGSLQLALELRHHLRQVRQSLALVGGELQLLVAGDFGGRQPRNGGLAH